MRKEQWSKISLDLEPIHPSFSFLSGIGKGIGEGIGKELEKGNGRGDGKGNGGRDWEGIGKDRTLKYYCTIVIVLIDLF